MAEPVRNPDGLKPCPFCGGVAKMKINASTLNCYAYCEKCAVTMKRKFNGHSKLHDILVELMADEWNRRSDNGN